MKIDKIEIAIAARACLDCDTEIETEAYLDAYADAVAEAMAEEYPDASVECNIDWSAPATTIFIDGGDLDINALEAAEETVRAVLQHLWDNPDKWWREVPPNA
jgi:hypothetical protein